MIHERMPRQICLMRPRRRSDLLSIAVVFCASSDCRAGAGASPGAGPGAGAGGSAPGKFAAPGVAPAFLPPPPGAPDDVERERLAGAVAGCAGPDV